MLTKWHLSHLEDQLPPCSNPKFQLQVRISYLPEIQAQIHTPQNLEPPWRKRDSAYILLIKFEFCLVISIKLTENLAILELLMSLEPSPFFWLKTHLETFMLSKTF